MFLQHHGPHDLPHHLDSGTLNAETQISYSSNVCKHCRLTGPNSLQSSARYAVLRSVRSLLLLCTCSRESRLKQVRLRGEGWYTAGKRRSLVVKIGSHIWFRQRYPQETHAFHNLRNQGELAWNGAPAAVRAIFPGVSKFFKQLRED